ncbi:hypothetical protein JHK87_042717 [Glycine soja]|nr:hypothetical protein JHK87_042717 [Glycine soja]
MSKARTAFHSAAAKAKHVLMDFKIDLGQTNSIKDFVASSRGSSSAREKANLSLSLVKALVLREKEDKLTSEFTSDEKLRKHWSEEKHLPRIPPDDIQDLKSCLLYQQFQVINCCTSRKKCHIIATESLDTMVMEANSNALESANYTGKIPPPHPSSIEAVIHFDDDTEELQRWDQQTNSEATVVLLLGRILLPKLRLKAYEVVLHV